VKRAIIFSFIKFQDKTHAMEILANKEYVYKKGNFSQGQRWSRGGLWKQVELLEVILQSFEMV
jgi:hypothetical protein